MTYHTPRDERLSANSPRTPSSRKGQRRKRAGLGRRLAIAGAALLLMFGCASAPEAAPPGAAAGAQVGALDSASPSAPSSGLASEPTGPASEPAPPPTVPAAPVIEKRRVTETQPIPYSTKTVNDSTLTKGTKQVRTKGVNGMKTLVYDVTLTDGAQTAKSLVSQTVTKQPVTEVVAVGTKTTAPPPKPGCHPSYRGVCVPYASDVDCAGGSGDGPAYVDGPFDVVGPDEYRLDHDKDGIGCE